jgi:hypothetical protein
VSTASLYVEPDMTPERCIDVIEAALAKDCHFYTPNDNEVGYQFDQETSLRQACAQLVNHYRNLVEDRSLFGCEDSP